MLKSSLPVGILGHESGFAPDGNTFYAASLGGGLLTAVDVTNPSLPKTIFTGHYDTHGVQISDDGNRAYLAAGAGFPRNEIGLPAALCHRRERHQGRHRARRRPGGGHAQGRGLDRGPLQPLPVPQ